MSPEIGVKAPRGSFLFVRGIDANCTLKSLITCFKQANAIRFSIGRNMKPTDIEATLEFDSRAKLETVYAKIANEQLKLQDQKIRTTIQKGTEGHAGLTYEEIVHYTKLRKAGKVSDKGVPLLAQVQDKGICQALKNATLFPSPKKQAEIPPATVIPKVVPVVPNTPEPPLVITPLTPLTIDLTQQNKPDEAESKQTEPVIAEQPLITKPLLAKPVAMKPVATKPLVGRPPSLTTPAARQPNPPPSSASGNTLMSAHKDVPNPPNITNIVKSAPSVCQPAKVASKDGSNSATPAIKNGSNSAATANPSRKNLPKPMSMNNPIPAALQAVLGRQPQTSLTTTSKSTGAVISVSSAPKPPSIKPPTPMTGTVKPPRPMTGSVKPATPMAGTVIPPTTGTVKYATPIVQSGPVKPMTGNHPCLAKPINQPLTKSHSQSGTLPPPSVAANPPPPPGGCDPNLDILITQEGHVPVLPNGNFRWKDVRRVCRFCNLETPNLTQFKTHSMGKKHLRNVENYENTGQLKRDIQELVAAGKALWQLSEPGTPTGIKKMMDPQTEMQKTLEEAIFTRDLCEYCPICFITLTALSQAKAHYAGKPHDKKFRQKTRERQIPKKLVFAMEHITKDVDKTWRESVVYSVMPDNYEIDYEKYRPPEVKRAAVNTGPYGYGGKRFKQDYARTSQHNANMYSEAYQQRDKKSWYPPAMQGSSVVSAGMQKQRDKYSIIAPVRSRLPHETSVPVENGEISGEIVEELSDEEEVVCDGFGEKLDKLYQRHNRK